MNVIIIIKKFFQRASVFNFFFWFFCILLEENKQTLTTVNFEKLMKNKRNDLYDVEQFFIFSFQLIKNDN